MSGHCDGNCDHCSHKKDENEALCKLRKNLSGVKNTLLVLSGKGGVGKSTVAVNIAATLAMAGRRVGILDVDVHGPSVPVMMGLQGALVQATDEGRILPINAGGIKVLSVGVVVQDPDAAVIWRGPMKIGVIQQFLSQTEWGELDYLIIDVPPGTGDEPLTICQTIPDPLGAVIVTTPQQVSAADVSRSIAFCRDMEFPVVGLVENMSGFVCPDCGKRVEIFPGGAADKLAKQYGIRILGRVPIDPRVAQSGDEGEPFMKRFSESLAVPAFKEIVDGIERCAAARNELKV